MEKKLKLLKFYVFRGITLGLFWVNSRIRELIIITTWISIDKPIKDALTFITELNRKEIKS